MALDSPDSLTLDPTAADSDPRRRALAVDFGLAFGAMGLGLLATPRASLGVGVLILLGFSMVATTAVLEQTDVLAVIDDRRPGSLLVVAAVTFGVALALVLGRIVVAWPSGPVLLGSGLGLAGYRTVYGLLRPVPERRITIVKRRRR